MLSVAEWDQKYNEYTKKFYNHSSAGCLHDNSFLTIVRFRSEDGCAGINVKCPLLKFHPAVEPNESMRNEIFENVQREFFNKVTELVKLSAFEDWQIRGRSGGWVVPFPTITIDDMTNVPRSLRTEFMVDNFLSLQRNIIVLLKIATTGIEWIKDEYDLEVFTSALGDL
jgi:hypothetical protein